ncbi:MAG: metal-dependent hydrolase [DPANN group archaeon]|nr:metal-dependent hydrolase [DPANN group archaeon]
MPMPTTHFLAGILAIKIISYFGFVPTIYDLILGGIIAACVDLDHVVVYYQRYKNLDFLKTFHNAISGIEEERSWIHEWNGIVFFFVISGITYFIAPHYAPLILAATMSHLLLDHEKIRYIHKKYIKFAHFVYPLSTTEILMNITILSIIILI